MQGFSNTEVFNDLAREALRLAVVCIETLPDPRHNDPFSGQEEWRCHEVARVVAAFIEQRIEYKRPFNVVDGTFDRVDHSWIVFLDSQQQLVILDPYSVGSLPQVQMHTGVSWACNRRDLYKVAHIQRQDLKNDVIAYLTEYLSDVGAEGMA